MVTFVGMEKLATGEGLKEIIKSPTVDMLRYPSISNCNKQLEVLIRRSNKLLEWNVNKEAIDI
jgi:hypothetical protein